MILRALYQGRGLGVPHYWVNIVSGQTSLSALEAGKQYRLVSFTVFRSSPCNLLAWLVWSKSSLTCGKSNDDMLNHSDIQWTHGVFMLLRGSIFSWRIDATRARISLLSWKHPLPEAGSPVQNAPDVAINLLLRSKSCGNLGQTEDFPFLSNYFLLIVPGQILVFPLYYSTGFTLQAWYLPRQAPRTCTDLLEVSVGIAWHDGLVLLVWVMSKILLCYKMF